MLQKFLESLFKSNEQNGKNKRQSLLMYLSIIAMAGILLMLLSSKIPTPVEDVNTVPNPTTAGTNQSVTPVFSTGSTAGSEEERIETSLKHMLSLIAGAGRVEVDITFENGTEFIYGFDSTSSNSKTEERDNNGGVRVIEDTSGSQNLVILRDKNGEERPVVQSEKGPKIAGVLVVAEGAGDARVEADIARAVSTVLAVPLHKICVLQYKR